MYISVLARIFLQNGGNNYYKNLSWYMNVSICTVELFSITNCAMSLANRAQQTDNGGFGVVKYRDMPRKIGLPRFIVANFVLALC